MAACKNSAEVDFIYVEDSESERKRIKLRAVETKKRRNRRKHTTVTIDSDIIGQCHAQTLDLPDCTGGLNTHISDDTERSCSKPPSESLLPPPPEDNRPRASSPPLVPSSDTNNTQGTLSEANIITRLGHLAYRQAESASDNVPNSRAGRSRSEPTSEVSHGKIERRSRSFQPDSSAKKLDVGPLLRCVSCHVQWTVRKNVTHKSTHMTTCARKNGINPSTLQVLVEKELLKLQQSMTNDQKRSCYESAIAAPQTYLETVVAEAQPRRKQRRTDTVGTLQPISQTRAAILDRAKALLGTREGVSCNAPEPEQTQSFGRSRLVTGQVEIFDAMLAHPSEESALTSRLVLLRSMAESPITYPP